MSPKKTNGEVIGPVEPSDSALRDIREDAIVTKEADPALRQADVVKGEITPEDIANNSYLVFEELRGINSELRREIDTGSATGLSGERARHYLSRFDALQTAFMEALGPIVPKDGTGVPDWAKKGPPYVIPDPSLQLGTANETPGNPARPTRAKLIDAADVDKNG